MNAVTELRTALEGFAPIDLEELNAHASLLSRVDRKYALHADQAGEILAQLQDYSDQGDPVRVLEIAQTRAHTYASHYFDTQSVIPSSPQPTGIGVVSRCGFATTAIQTWPSSRSRPAARGGGP